MRLFYVLTIALFISTININAAFATAPAENEQITEAYKALAWKPAGKYKLDKSHSSLTIPDGFVALTDRDARKAIELSGNPKEDSLEALVINIEKMDEVHFSHFNEGYVKIDDWNEIDAKSMLASISENTEEANKLRRANGISGIHVKEWLLEPTLNKETNTVYWAIGAIDDTGASFVNSIALRLGRYGFEKLTWIADRQSYVPVGGDLDLMLRAHSYDVGHRYSDFIPSDKTATYGIAGLVTAVAGAKVAKAAAAGGFLLFFKNIAGFLLAILLKAKVLLLIPLIWLGSLFKNLLFRKKLKPETPLLEEPTSNE